MKLNGIVTDICIFAWRLHRHNALREIADIQIEHAQRVLRR